MADEPNRTSLSSVADAQHRPIESASPLSLGRLRAAFAQMLGSDASDAESAAAARSAAGQDPCELSPRSVVEAMLFVGRPDDQAISAREMAAAMRGVSPGEIDTAVAELNRLYERDAAPYAITGTANGYRLALRDDFNRMRDKYYGRLKEARLSAAAIETLSIVAYNQPATCEAVSQLRGTPSGPALASLVRRRLLRIDRPGDRREPPTYSTTERFLRLFGLESVAALPRSEEVDKN